MSFALVGVADYTYQFRQYRDNSQQSLRTQAQEVADRLQRLSAVLGSIRRMPPQQLREMERVCPWFIDQVCQICRNELGVEGLSADPHCRLCGHCFCSNCLKPVHISPIRSVQACTTCIRLLPKKQVHPSEGITVLSDLHTRLGTLYMKAATRLENVRELIQMISARLNVELPDDPVSILSVASLVKFFVIPLPPSALLTVNEHTSVPVHIPLFERLVFGVPDFDQINFSHLQPLVAGVQSGFAEIDELRERLRKLRSLLKKPWQEPLLMNVRNSMNSFWTLKGHQLTFMTYWNRHIFESLDEISCEFGTKLL